MRFVTKTTLSRAVLAASALVVLAGCGVVAPLPPRGKGTLARPDMAFGGGERHATICDCH